jgi:hypothetical protein
VTLPELLRREASHAAVRGRQQRQCGALATHRNGSGVEAATVCELPRDTNLKVMGIGAAVAAAVFALQADLAGAAARRWARLGIGSA